MLPDISVIQINKYFSDIYHSKDLEDNLEINKMLGHMKPKAEDARTRPKNNVGLDHMSVKHEDTDEE